MPSINIFLSPRTGGGRGKGLLAGRTWGGEETRGKRRGDEEGGLRKKNRLEEKVKEQRKWKGEEVGYFE